MSQSDQIYPTQTLPPEQVAQEHYTDSSGMFPPTRVMSPVSAVVVRQDDPAGPRYQEALGYQFLINNAKFPGLTRMDDGKLVLTITTVKQVPLALESDQSSEDVGLILFSEDEGMSWSQPQQIGVYRCTPVNLGGSKLMLRGYPIGYSDDTDTQSLGFSDDAGATWSGLEPVPSLPDGRPAYTDVALHPLVENGKARFAFYSPLPEDHPARADDIGAQTILRTFDSADHTWGEPDFLPVRWRSSEACITRAHDGVLVGAFRTCLPKIPELSDAWRGISTSRSSDDGQTWEEPVVHSRYGHVHTHLAPLADGRILMTFAARIGELEGRSYHGIEAVISPDSGKTWDWAHRYILFRWPDTAMHSPQSVQLNDGRILTIVFHHTTCSWTNRPDGDRDGNVIRFGHVSVVIWSP